MKDLIIELRMYFAEKLLIWSYHIASKNHKDGKLLREKVLEYARQALDE